MDESIGKERHDQTLKAMIDTAFGPRRWEDNNKSSSTALGEINIQIEGGKMRPTFTRDGRGKYGKSRVFHLESHG